MYEFNIPRFAPNVCSMIQSGMSSGELYPPIEPLHTFMLHVSPLHSLYVEECGNPKGIPVVVLHGGPGGGSSPLMRRFFNPLKYRIILFDQRGSGRSIPSGELRENTTRDLVEDIEKIRHMLSIERWLLFGGSWGSTLALTYAVCHPEQVLGVVSRGIFLGRPCETEWFYGSTGARNVFPDRWENFSGMEGLKPEKTGKYYVSQYRKRLTSPVLSIQLDAARRWNSWETFCDRLQVDIRAVWSAEQSPTLLSSARIENHYFYNNFFFDNPDWLLQTLKAATDLRRQSPFVFAQGRYDMDCPRRTAWDVANAWPEAEMITMPLANHMYTDQKGDPVVRALTTSTDWFALCLL